jgi:hypothetical protein
MGYWDVRDRENEQVPPCPSIWCDCASCTAARAEPQNPYPLPTADCDVEPVEGCKCYACGEEFLDAPDLPQPWRCPMCGTLGELQPETFHSCGSCWHTNEQDAAKCADDRIEAARDEADERRMDERRNRW